MDCILETEQLTKEFKVGFKSDLHHLTPERCCDETMNGPHALIRVLHFGLETALRDDSAPQLRPQPGDVDGLFLSISKPC